MPLTKNQKKHIKKYAAERDLSTISKAIGVDKNEVLVYLKEISPEKKFKLKKWIINHYFQLIILGLFVIIGYVNTIDNAFLSDDIKGILLNEQIGKFESITNNPRTLVKTSLYFILVNVFGRTPEPFHLLNMLFHLLNTLTLFFLLKLLFEKGKTPIIAASLFAVHPILTEAVTWISGGYFVYSAFFVLASFSAYIISKRNKNKFCYWLSVGLFFLGLETTEKVVAFPGVLLFYELALGSLKKNWKKLIPFFGLSSIWVLHLIGMIPQRIETLETRYYQKTKLQNPLRQIPVAITTYLQLFFWPDKLTLYQSEVNILTMTELYIRIGIFFSCAAGTIYAYFKNKKVFFWLMFSPIILSPMLTPFGISWLVAERYIYLAIIGVIVVVAIGINYLNNLKIYKNLALIIFFSLIIPALTIRTIVRNNDWQNQDTLWLAAARTSPHSPQNHNNLGDLYGRKKQWDKSIQYFKRAIELNPQYADAMHNLANIYWQTGEIDKAVEYYQQALEHNPMIWQSHQNLAAIYYDQKDFDQAKQHLEKLLELYPGHEKGRKLLNQLKNNE